MVESLLQNPMDIYGITASSLGIPLWIAFTLFAAISVWSLVWKGLALWKSSKKNQPIWFIILLVVNTVGILEILYIFIFSKMNFKGKKGKIETQKEPVKKKSQPSKRKR